MDALWVVLGLAILMTVLAGAGLVSLWWSNRPAPVMPEPKLLASPPETQPALTKQEREYFEAVEEIERLEEQAYAEIERLLRW